MRKYDKKGLYAAYDKNHKERQKEDYYATPPEEVDNILNRLEQDDLLKLTDENYVLEPACGGGHMIQGILTGRDCLVTGSDIKDRHNELTNLLEQSGLVKFHWGTEYDYLSDDYPFSSAEYIIMNPPFSLIEPFVIRSLEIADKGVLMFGRLQFLEGEGRFNNILKENPPTDIYGYVDRVACYKDGDFSIKPSSVQAYAWFYWDKIKERPDFPRYHWIRRVGK